MAAKIKNHSKLGLSFAEFGALLGTRTMLANKAITYAKGNSYPDSKNHKFHMGIPCRTKDCGSVSCIGGTMGQIMGMNTYDADQYVMDHDPTDSNLPISTLFFPPHKYNYAKITTEQAVKAIDNFLATGKPRWEKVLPKSALEKE